MSNEIWPQKAWLYRHGCTKPWLFETSPQFDELIHTTSRGTVYAIFADHKHGKPFWIGRLAIKGIGWKVWVTCEASLRARSIVFDGAGEYVFKQLNK